MLEKYMYLKSDVTGQLTKNFSLNELNHSGCATTKGITNIATGYAAQNQQWLAIVLQLVRDKFNVPMTITSGYRSPEVNKGVSGAKNSSHMHGSAADVQFSDVPKGLNNHKKRAYEIAAYFDSIGLIYDQIIYYKSWVHIGMRFRSKGRMQVFAGKG